ncbi:MAG: hypothetical protein EOM67_08535 [Spirochaetia bacterium]|nr:hypothetical protein [Spirochaetia bacterium]
MHDWQKEEKLLARRLSGRETRGSGRGNQKGDVRAEEYVAEQKLTSKPFYSLSFITLKKITEEAWLSFKEPLFSATITVNDELLRFHVLRTTEECAVVKAKSYRITQYSDGDEFQTPYGSWKVEKV